MHPRDAAEAVLRLYPQIYHACHTRHVRDPGTGEVLSAYRAGILSHLDDVTPTSMTALAEHMGVTLSTMSLTAKALVRGGWVKSERSARDRRVAELRLTEAGVRMRDTQSVLDAARVLDVVASLPDAERAAAIRGLELLAQAGQERMAEWTRARSAPGEAGWPAEGR